MNIAVEDFAVIVHEAAHCVIGNRLGLMVKWVEFGWQNGVWEGGGLSGGSRVVEGPNLVDWLTMLLAGEKAEVEFFGRQILPRVHARSDRERFYKAVVEAGPMGRQAEFIARQKVVRMVRAHRGAIFQMSHGLLALVDHAQGADVSVAGEQLVTMLGGRDVAILRLAASGGSAV